jgi:uncharacterized protein involved in exopolysaccharide biosynthesis
MRANTLRVVFSRWLDLVFQYLGRLAVALVVLPAVAGLAYLAIDRTQVVSTRIWADPPAYSGQDLSPVGPQALFPADSDISIMNELVLTDSFVDQVLGADPTYPGQAEDAKVAMRASFRSSLQVSRQGPNLIGIQYTTSDPTYGVGLLNNLVKVYGDTLKKLQLNLADAAGNVLQSQLQAALTDRDAAVGSLQAFVDTHSALTPEQLAADPTYVTLSGQAHAKSDQYLTLLVQSEQVDMLRAAVPNAQPTAFHVVDPPTLEHTGLSLKSPAVRITLQTLAGVAGFEMLLIYVMARRDPRIRSGEDAARVLDVPYLGSTRAIGA